MGHRMTRKHGTLLERKQLQPQKDLVTAIAEVREGKFHPERENDELTKALGNPEHTGRTRGYGPSVPWKTGFPEYSESYRSRSCLLYTSDAADEEDSVDLGGRRIIKKKK